jgi:hypothetical protein
MQKYGGFAALYQAAAYVMGMVFFLVLVSYPTITDPVEKVATLAQNRTGMYALHLVTYVVFGISLVVLALALYERLKAGAPALMQVATAIGLIWAGLLIASGMIFNVGMGPVIELYASDPEQAGLVWLSIEAVSEGLSGNGEVLGGLWTLLVSVAALRTMALPRGLNYLGVIIGVAGILSVIPALGNLVIVFGLAQIIWFAWLGIIMLSSGAARRNLGAEPAAAL